MRDPAPVHPDTQSRLDLTAAGAARFLAELEREERACREKGSSEPAGPSSPGEELTLGGWGLVTPLAVIGCWDAGKRPAASWEM